MYRSIMVPLNGTAFAEEALPTAIRLARASGARLSLVRVVDRSVPSMYLTSPLASESWNDTPADRAVHYLEHVSTRILARTGVSARVSVLRGGIASALSHEAAETRCDLIVMSTHAHGPFGRVFQSSVADKVARNAPCPVLFVRATGTECDWSIHKRFGHVLVPLDGSRSAEQALVMAMKLADPDEARLTILHVARPQLVAASVGAPLHASPESVPPEDLERMSRDYLQSVAERVEQRARPFTDVRIEDGPPADAIVGFAVENGVDLIAMTTRGLSGVRRVMLGSVASAVLRKFHAAVLLLPPNATG